MRTPSLLDESRSIEAVFLSAWTFLVSLIKLKFRFAHGDLSFISGAERRPHQLHLLRRQAAAEPVRQLKRDTGLSGFSVGCSGRKGLAGGEASAPAARSSSSFRSYRCRLYLSAC